LRGLGQAVGAHLHELAWGRDPRSVEPVVEDRSIGHEETFSRDVDDPDVVRRELLKLSERSAARLRTHGLVARTVSIKIRFADFTTITRSRTLRDATDIGREVYAAARSLYDGLGLQRARLRLVGVRLEGLVAADSAPRQLALDERPVGWREADRAVDVASARFGAGVVRPASLVPDRRDGPAQPKRDEPG